MSEGEEFICMFLEDSKIEFRQEVIIDGLVGDSANHRRSDFYLPRYNVYIEYFGQWNNEKEKPRYREKRKVYINNKIPCIILYPENLGIIEFVFHKRLDYVFNRYQMENQRKKYYFDQVKDETGDRILYIIIALLIIFFNYDSSINLFDNYWFMTGIGLLLFQLYKIFSQYQDIKRGKNPFEYHNQDEEVEK